MTNEGAIEKLVELRHMHERRVFCAISDETDEALGMAIAALKKAPTALDHIHNVVAEREYQRGYEQGKADAEKELHDKFMRAIPAPWK